MADQNYPAYVQQMLEEAERTLTDPEDPGPCEAAAICFDILALFPEHRAAQAFILRAYRDPNLIRDNRRALSRLIDEWDDRPWQQHRRLALSFRYVSRWGPPDQDDSQGLDYEEHGPGDVQKYLQAGHLQLLEDYLGGQAKGAEGAWQIFQEAIRLAQDPRATMFWVAREYSEQGYFAEAVDILQELLKRYPDDRSARRLWVEVRWWRDHQHQIPWIPPAGDGSRFRRMMLERDPDGLAAAESPQSALNQYRPPDPDLLPPTMKPLRHVPSELENTLKGLLAEQDGPDIAGTTDPLVNWGYLDAIERRQIDVSQFPRWARDYLDDIDDPEQRKDVEDMLLEQFSNTSLYDDAYFEEDEDSDEDDDRHDHP